MASGVLRDRRVVGRGVEGMRWLVVGAERERGDA
jgi:hypothetical protein